MEYFGYKVEPFSMKADRETGVIHEDGFVEVDRKKERENRHGVILFIQKLILNRDPWLDSLEEVEDPRAKVKRVAKEESSDDETPLDPKERFHLTKELFDLLQPGNN